MCELLKLLTVSEPYKPATFSSLHEEEKSLFPIFDYYN